MRLEKDEYKIQDDGIWISKKALEELRQYYKRAANNATPYNMYYVGMADILTDILKHFEPLEP